jgi:hypothetical protein
MCAHFVALFIFLLVNLAFALCIVGEFAINVAHMFNELGVECMLWQVWRQCEYI